MQSWLPLHSLKVEIRAFKLVSLLLVFFSLFWWDRVSLLDNKVLIYYIYKFDILPYIDYCDYLCTSTVNVLKFQTLYSILFCLNFVFIQLFLKILSGVANSADPDQTAPSGAVWSGSALFACAICQKLWCMQNFRTITLYICPWNKLWEHILNSDNINFLQNNIINRLLQTKASITRVLTSFIFDFQRCVCENAFYG